MKGKSSLECVLYTLPGSHLSACKESLKKTNLRSIALTAFNRCNVGLKQTCHPDTSFYLSRQGAYVQKQEKIRIGKFYAVWPPYNKIWNFYKEQGYSEHP